MYSNNESFLLKTMLKGNGLQRTREKVEENQSFTQSRNQMHTLTEQHGSFLNIKYRLFSSDEYIWPGKKDPYCYDDAQ